MRTFFNKLKNFFSSGKSDPKSANPKSENVLADAVLHEEDFNYRLFQIQPTPNPNAYQFFVNQPIFGEGSINYTSPEDAENDSFTQALFNIYGVVGVYIKANFITVTKSEIAGWPSVSPLVEKAIQTHLSFHPQAPSERRGSDPLELNEFRLDDFLNFPKEQQETIINAIFDSAIRPALTADGGDITLIGLEGNAVRVRYQGACGTCPSATQGTLKYIENTIKEYLHPDLKVEVA